MGSRKRKAAVLEEVQKDGSELRALSEDFRGDFDIVLAAVKQHGLCLQHAADSCRSNREIVMAAVQRHGWALRYAADSCRSDREIVLKAVHQIGDALLFAADGLLEDASFAPEAKMERFLLKITMLSGRSTLVATHRRWANDLEAVLQRCCARLGRVKCSSMALKKCQRVQRCSIGQASSLVGR
mmetsp:Transcript_63244/g.117673  ORF Transcript_63244/g.117673 Transcript_63244/m.117673 type:complete len:184 (+) Transcript_63244:92-643(+)